MKNMTITEYLQENDPLHFDFTDDCTDSTAYQTKKGLEKFFIFRSPKPVGKEIYQTAILAIEKNYETYGSIGDPDLQSKLLQSIYLLLWPEIKECKSEYMLNNCGGICSDTMTSVQTTLNHYLEKNLPELLKEYGVKKVSSKMCIELYENKHPAFIKLLENNENLIHFISVYHTLGNYIAVPAGFNVARSGFYGSHDYWDLTLMKIKEYYDAKTTQGELLTCPAVKIMELLHCNSAVVNCYRWLESFESWEDFVKRNFLQDFVDENNQPIPLCKGHSWECPQVQDFDEFFETTWRLIEKRSDRMIKELKNREGK